MSVRAPSFLRRLARALALVLTLGFAAAALGPSPARAGEGQPSAMSRLSAVELEHLRRNVPDWDDLPDERREKIAANVIRLRELPPEERARLRQRMERFRTEAPALRERLPDRLAHLQGRDRERFRVQALVAGAIGREVLRTLPDDARRQILLAAAPGPAGAPSAPPARPVLTTVFGFAFSRAVMEREAESIARSGEAQRHTPSAEAEPRFRAVLAKVNAAAPEDRPRELRALAMLVIEDRAREAIRPLLAPPPAPRVDDAALAGALRKAFPEAWRATSEDLLERSRRGAEDLRRFIARNAPKPERRAGARTTALLLVRFLDQSAPWIATNPEARDAADRLLQAVLVKGLGLPPAVLERLPAWDRPNERIRAVRRLLLARPGEGPRDR